MTHKKLSPEEIAHWRLEQLTPLLEPGLTKQMVIEQLHQISQRPVLWPNGKSEPISRATIYRWHKTFIQEGLVGLQPKIRHDRGKPRKPLPEAVITKALDALSADPEMSLTFLVSLLEAHFSEEKISVPRSTLQRTLAKHPTYTRLCKARKQTQRRTRFVAAKPHHIWQCDAKGPFVVRLTSGSDIKAHVLTILDDCTRSVLAARVTLNVNLACAITVFRAAALRWGLPQKMYCDRASIFDAHSFRNGLAHIGSYRIPTLPRNAEARGKIESYHRTLSLWFVKRLGVQQVIDLEHLQHLLDGIIGGLYQTHRHRGLKQTPEQALGGVVSPRVVPVLQLHEAFRQKKKLKAHPKTGEVEIAQKLYLVPDDLRGKRLTFLIDPPGDIPPMVCDPVTGKQLPLRPAAVTAADVALNEGPNEEKWAPGPLQTITDNWAGRQRPQAEPGFGLPEIYAILTQIVGRPVPGTDHEAAAIQQMYFTCGALPRQATQRALRQIADELGPKRPIIAYMEALVQRVKNESLTREQ